MAEERKYVLSNTCFRCKKLIVEMTDQESGNRFGGICPGMGGSFPPE